jgi:hypothetical protein
MKITAADIRVEHGRATMRVTLEDGTEQDAMSWYVDELTFSPQDAIGRTVEELRGCTSSATAPTCDRDRPPATVRRDPGGGRGPAHRMAAPVPAPLG